MDRNDLLRQIKNTKAELTPLLTQYEAVAKGAKDDAGKERPFTADEWANHERLGTDINNLNKQLISHTQALKAIDMCNASDDETAEALGLSGREKLPTASEEYSNAFREFLLAGATDQAKTAIFTTDRFKNLSTVSPSTGGVLIPTDLEAGILMEALDLSALLDISDVTFTSSVKSQVPFMADLGIAAPRKEMEAYMMGDPTLSAKSIEMFNYGLIFPVSQELLADRTDLDPALRRAIGRCYARTIEEYGLKGTSGQTAFVDQAGNVAAVTLTGRVCPGILSEGAGVIPVVTGSGAASITADDIIKLKQAVDPEARSGGIYLISGDFETKALLLKDSTGQPIWRPNLIVGQPSTLNGSAYRVSSRLADVAASKTPALFGDFKRGHEIKIRKGMEVATSGHFYFGNGGVAFKGDFRFGQRVRYNKYISRLNTPAS